MVPFIHFLLVFPTLVIDAQIIFKVACECSSRNYFAKCNTLYFMDGVSEILLRCTSILFLLVTFYHIMMFSWMDFYEEFI